MERMRAVAVLFVAALLLVGGPVIAERTAGEVLDDATITARVKTEIARTQGLGEAVAVNVDTYRGEVSLAGRVDSEQQRKAAEDAARRISGVEKVTNNLQLKNQPARAQ